MQRTYDPRKAKSNRSYTVKQAAEIFNVHPATVRGWTRNGLKLLDSRHPPMIHGPELRRYLAHKQAARKWPKAPDTLPCFTCSGPRKIRAGSFKIIQTNTTKIKIRGACITCGQTIGRGDVKDNIVDLQCRFSGKSRNDLEA